jgi:hypothetical protein
MKLTDLHTLAVKQEPIVESAMNKAITALNVTKLDVKDLQIASEHAGYTDEYEGYTACVYGSFIEKTNSHKYYLLWENQDADDEEKPFAINSIFLALGKSGFIEAEPSGNPAFDNLTKDEGVTKLASLKGK